MYTKTPKNSPKLLSEEEDAKDQENNDIPNQIESLIEISSSSTLSTVATDQKKSSDQPEVERVVKETLQKFQLACNFGDSETLSNLLVPKVLYDLHAFDRLHEDVQSMKQSLDSYIHHTRVLGEDIAEIFLDLHNIYSRLEKFDKQPVHKQRDENFSRRLCEAEEFIGTTKHYIVNEVPVPKTTSQPELGTERDRNELSKWETRSAERNAFLTNMLVIKKSDFSIKLNRTKNHYVEAERILKSKKSDKKERM